MTTSSESPKLKPWTNEDRDLQYKYRRISFMKNKERKNIELKVSEYYENEEKKHLEALRQHHHNVTTALKDFTVRIILRISGTFVQSLLSIFACIVYIVNTYMDGDNDQALFQVFEILIASLFSVDYMWGFFQAANKKKFIFNILNMIDLFTILPVFVSFIGDTKTRGIFKFVRILRAVRVFRILRLYRLFVNVGHHEEETALFIEYSDVKRKGLMIFSTLLSMLFIAAGVFQSFQDLEFLDFVISVPNNEKLTFDASFYFMLSTLTTIGYGDIRPASTSSRLFVGLFMISFIFLVSKQIVDLNELLKYNSQYCAPCHCEPFKHVVLTGNITKISLVKFIKEFYHTDHESKTHLKIIIVQATSPSSETLGVLTNPKYEENLQYIVGNIFRENVMRMAKIHTSKGVFILSNQHLTNSQKDDTFAILASKAIHEFSPKTKIFVQLISPNSLLHSWADWDVCMSTQAFKMGIIVTNAFYPGFGTWISNLIISSKNFMKREIEGLKWAMEYAHGLSQELFIEKLPESLIGMEFYEILQSMYKISGVLMFGIKSLVNLEYNYYDVLINPIEYKIKNGDYGIFLSSSRKKANNFNKVEHGFKNIYDHIDPSNEKHLLKLEIKPVNKESKGVLSQDLYLMSEIDMRGKIWNHLLVFGKIDGLSDLFDSLTFHSNQYICFVNDSKPCEKWQKIRIKFPKAIYFECNLTDIEEIARTAINFAYHTILLTWEDENSNIPDSGILALARLIDENFTTPFTLELKDEANMRYLKNRPNLIWDNISYIMWPRYAASNIFFSSTLDNILPQEFYNSSFIDVIGKLVTCDRFFDQKKEYEENHQINIIVIPDHIANKCKYIQLILHFTRRPRPLIPLGILRSTNAFDNEYPVFISNPDPEAPLLKGDLILVLGSLIKNAIELQKPDETDQENVILLNQPKNKPLIDLANKWLNEEENLEVDDEDLIEKIQQELANNKKEREALKRQNETIRNLLTEYNLIEKALDDKINMKKERDIMHQQNSIQKAEAGFNIINFAKKNSVLDINIQSKEMKKKLKKTKFAVSNDLPYKN